jgi:hypothetical protein
MRRRRLRKYIPIFLVALAIQILAPIGASWAAAASVSDPLAALEICHGSPDAAPGDNGQGDRSGHEADCQLCCALNASHSTDTPRIATQATPPHREVEVILSGYEAPLLLPVRTGSNSLARGPPQAI